MIAIPAVGAIVLALFALLFMLAWQAWGTTIVRTLSINLPIIGNVIGNAVAALLEGTYAVAATFFDAVIGPITSLILSPIVAVENIFTLIVQNSAALYNKLYVVVRSTIPAALATAESYALDLSNYVLSQAQALAATNLALINYVQSQAAALVNSAVSTLTADINYVATQAADYAYSLYQNALGAINYVQAQAIAYANAIYADAVNFTVTEVNKAIAYAESVAAAAATDTVHALATAEAYADTTATHIAGVLVTDAEQELVQAVNAIWPDVVNGVIAVQGVIATDLPDIAAGLRAIPVSKALTWGESLAGVAAVSVPMLKALEQCVVPNCRNLSQLGRDLQALLGLVEDASFLAFLIELITKPDAAYQTVDDIFGPALNAAASGAKDLFGL